MNTPDHSSGSGGPGPERADGSSPEDELNAELELGEWSDLVPGAAGDSTPRTTTAFDPPDPPVPSTPPNPGPPSAPTPITDAPNGPVPAVGPTNGPNPNGPNPSAPNGPVPNGPVGQAPGPPSGQQQARPAEPAARAEPIAKQQSGSEFGDWEAGLRKLQIEGVRSGPSRPLLVLAGVVAVAVLAAIALFTVAALTGGEDGPAGGDNGGGGFAGRTQADPLPPEFGYDDNLAMIRGHSERNTLFDGSPWRDLPMDELDVSDASRLLGPRLDYLNNPNGNPEQSFPIPEGGQFRTACEFSHFAYDDPILHPNQPGKAHLHMFFGNTDINAFSTYETMRDSGSGTCNGQELNRTGYWAPAMIDGDGNVRIPERIVVYYKGEGLANGGNFPDLDVGAKVYEPNMANIASQPESVPEISSNDGGETGEFNFSCTNNFSPEPYATGIDTIPNCSGDHWQEAAEAPYPETRTVLEMKVLFWNCYQPEGDDNDWTRWQPAGEDRGTWYLSNCDGQGGAGSLPVGDKDHYPNITYFINYVVEPGEDTSTWFLSSDVDGSIPDQPQMTGTPGSSHHADWWGAWHPDINQEFIDNCINFSLSPQPSGCGFGYLSDGGPDGALPVEGRALRYRRQYDTVGDAEFYKVPLENLFRELCEPLEPLHAYDDDNPMTGGYCRP